VGAQQRRDEPVGDLVGEVPPGAGDDPPAVHRRDPPRLRPARVPAVPDQPERQVALLAVPRPGPQRVGDLDQLLGVAQRVLGHQFAQQPLARRLGHPAERHRRLM
jgi:hypothetical protein